MKHFPLACLLLLATAASAADTPELITTGQWRHEEVTRFKADEANQGVVADDEHLYVINNTSIGKYRKSDHTRVAAWKDEKGGPFIHLNAGTMHQGQLWCAHSNFPGIPMTSSVEVFDPVDLRHIASHSLGIASGSLTWITWHQGHWFACFAHYSKSQVQTGRDPAWTELIRYDAEWRRTGGWTFPDGIVQIFGTSSCSGGSIAADGTLFITGHDAAQLFVLRFPRAGSTLEWIDSIPMSAEGQSFSWDPTDPGLFYGIRKKSKEVIVSRITKTAP